MTDSNWSVAITGSGGTGSVTAGMILLEALALSGFYGVMTRSYGPQIRGGESAVMIRFGHREIQSQSDRFDVLLALDWANIERFADEITLSADSVLIGDAAAGDAPAVLTQNHPTVCGAPLADTAASLEGGRANMVGLGLLAAWIGLHSDVLLQALDKILGRKSEAIRDASRAGIEAGRALLPDELTPLPAPPGLGDTPRWTLSGNEAAACGALLGGIRFVAAYPITPASDLLEWMAPRLEQLGGALLQAEDELASINMIIGASYGGVPSLTATSGPGLSLMSEALGLAVASEVPVVVVNVSRGGPSTGIPTKPEQSDLNIAIHGLHGDAPHVVVAPLSVKDCLGTTQWAVELAEALQTPAIVLSDQMLAQAHVITDAEDTAASPPKRVLADGETLPYQRYSLTDSGISPMSIPGMAGGQYTADGLEHSELGHPSSLATDHERQSAKRLQKLTGYDYADRWGAVSGTGTTALISWGSSSEVAAEAAERLRAEGLPVRLLRLRLLAPLPVEALRAALSGVTRALVVELNQSGQLFHHLRAHDVLPDDSTHFSRAGPVLIRPGEIVDHVLKEYARAS